MPPRIGSHEGPLGRLELVHCIVFAACFQSCFTGKILLVIITNVAASHILVFDAGDALADFFTLDVLDVTEHRLIAEIFTGEVVRLSLIHI